MRGAFGPCICGATDCPSCGPAQGYVVIRSGNRWINPEYEDELPEPDVDCEDELEDEE